MPRARPPTRHKHHCTRERFWKYSKPNSFISTFSDVAKCQIDPESSWYWGIQLPPSQGPNLPFSAAAAGLLLLALLGLARQALTRALDMHFGTALVLSVLPQRIRRLPTNPLLRIHGNTYDNGCKIKVMVIITVLKTKIITILLS